MQRSGDAPPQPLQHQHLQAQLGDPRPGENDALWTAAVFGSRKAEDGTEGRTSRRVQSLLSTHFCSLAASIHDAPFMYHQEWERTARKTLKQPVGGGGATLLAHKADPGAFLTELIFM